ncbi:hypothetical protein A3306_06610 [Rickettsia bellii]|uniref:Uncharacterized protein n=1 Tax=Rickettsia bellii str. RML An4 TaxID=1359193 RepID=A0A0F3QB77_RICBE|nr:hypothetical protein [Rickettsia bellii]ARD86794.1 hypothetical protein A3306_06610 [Rickettsia bellii]KJV89507.1 hypothetical protein RBEAN4_0485 [Rickettsia bellii str. RML An4]
MKAEFDKEGNFIPPKLSSAIEDHYATLADKGGFYDKRSGLSSDPKETNWQEILNITKIYLLKNNMA